MATTNYLPNTLALKSLDEGKLIYKENSQSYILKKDSEEHHVCYTAISGDFIFETTIYQYGDKIPVGAGIFIRKDATKENNGAILQLQSNNGINYTAYLVDKNKTAAPKFVKLEAREEYTEQPFEPTFLRIERQGSKIIATTYSIYMPSFSFDTTILNDINDWQQVEIGITSSKAVKFANVRISRPATKTDNRIAETDQIISRLEIMAINNHERKIIYEADSHFEAPNWHQFDNYLIFNQQGLLYTINPNGGQPTLLPTGNLKNCNNDHGITPDGNTIIISNNDPEFNSRIYTMPLKGGEPTLITPLGPSYWHGVSPDGKTLAYVANRTGDYNIYTIPISGGKEKQITSAKGLDDGPDYSIDGQYIFMNSMQSGNMRIWQMKPDGSEQRQLTDDEAFQDWFPHPSPDGRWLIFLSYPKEVSPSSHPFGERVVLRLLDLKNIEKEPMVLAHLYGGQGTINVPSWSPDSKQVAFVSYSSKKKD